MRLKFIGIFACLFLISGRVEAGDIPKNILAKCQQEIVRNAEIDIFHQYGKLIFDNTKSMTEISQVCDDAAAGCFKGGWCQWNTKMDLKAKINLGRYVCAVPKISVNVRYKNAFVYVTKEYPPCETRAVLRHELQHFTIWKTAQEAFLEEIKSEIKKYIYNSNAVCLSNDEGCLYSSATQTSFIIKNIYDKWHKIQENNDVLLDKIDHNMKTEVNYRVCAPYSLKMYSR